MTWPSTLPTILPLLILTPSKTSPCIRISFNFSLSFLSSSACFLVRSGEIKMSLKRHITNLKDSNEADQLSGLGRWNHGDKGAAVPCLFGNGQGATVSFLSKSKKSHIIY